MPLMFLTRQIALGDIAGDGIFGALAETRQQHFHLRDRGVLRFVYDNKSIAQRAAPHKGQRRHFNL